MCDDELTVFLDARLAEDELTARDSVEYLLDGAELPGLDWYALPEWARLYLASWLPARVFREVAAKRAIIKSQCSPYVPGHVPATAVLRHLAAVWSDHPDYRQKWQP